MPVCPLPGECAAASGPASDGVRGDGCIAGPECNGHHGVHARRKERGAAVEPPPFLLLIAELAAWQLEACNPGKPARRRGGLASGGVVLVGVPEGAVVNRVDVERGVVTPT